MADVEDLSDLRGMLATEVVAAFKAVQAERDALAVSLAEMRATAQPVVEMFPGNLLDHHFCDGSEFCTMDGGWEARHHAYYCYGCDEAVPCDCDSHQDGVRWAHLRAWERFAHDAGCPLKSLADALLAQPAPDRGAALLQVVRSAEAFVGYASGIDWKGPCQGPIRLMELEAAISAQQSASDGQRGG